MDIHYKQVSFAYEGYEQQSIIRNVTVSITQGEYVTIVGANGSGKSTLMKLLNGLLLPTHGDIRVGEWSTTKPEDRKALRQQVGMVFQNPENQIVGTTVLDDVAFGLENIGYPPDQMMERIEQVLGQVQMSTYSQANPHHLSGGQKQRVAVAGVLAMRPAILVFDEATSMLDPEGRQQLHSLMRQLHQEGLTILSVTHDMEEVEASGRVLAMRDGEIVFDGTPATLFQQPALLAEWKLDTPFSLKLRTALEEAGVQFQPTIQTKEEMVQYLWTLQSKI